MLELQVTPKISAFLEQAGAADALPQSIRSLAAECCAAQRVKWSTLKTITNEHNKAVPGSSVSLHDLCQGSSLSLNSPAPRQRSPELQARLAKLQEQVDNMRYDAMVADITQPEREAEARRGEMLATTYLQFGFGVHVIVTMGTFFALGYVPAKYLFKLSETWAGMLGALGLTVGLLLETVLLIIRSNMPKPLHQKYPELFDTKLWGPNGTLRSGANGKGTGSSTSAQLKGRGGQSEQKSISSTTGGQTEQQMEGKKER
mmetsp:Transcript_5349/g.11701  ORF Transcript_5349/g.11701 Transcript_5349/m.11701 type:complete len:259 (-) Transcript_5349:407-1183(-)